MPRPFRAVSGFDAHDERGINLAKPILDNDFANKIWTEEQIAAQSRLKGTYTPDSDGLGTPLPDLDSLVPGVDVLTADYWTVDLSGRPQSGPQEAVDLNADDRLVANIGPNAVDTYTMNPALPTGLMPNTKVRFNPIDPTYTGSGQALGLVLTTDGTGAVTAVRLANRGLGYEAGEVLNATIENSYINAASGVTFTNAPGWALAPDTTYYNVALTNTVGTGQGLIVDVRTDATGGDLAAVYIRANGAGYAVADTMDVAILGTPVGSLAVGAVHTGIDVPCQVTIDAIGDNLGWTLIRGAGLTRAQADKDYLRLDGGNEPNKAINWGNQQLKDLADPLDPQDAVNFRTLNSGVSALGVVVTRPGHGLVNGTPLYQDATGAWVLAQADAVGSLSQGLCLVTGPDTFSVIMEGRMNWPAHGYFPGTSLYVSQDVAGELISQEPSSGLIQFACEVLDDNMVFVRDQAAYERSGNDLNAIGTPVPASTVLPANLVSYSDVLSAPEVTGLDVQAALESVANTFRGFTSGLPGYFEPIAGAAVVGQWVKICEIKKFTTGDFYVSTNQSGNAPSIKLTIVHPYTPAKCYLSAQTCSNSGVPWDRVALFASGGNGSPVSVWLRWGQVSSANLDIAFAWAGSGTEPDPVTWDAAPPVTATPPGSQQVSIDFESPILSVFPGLSVPEPPPSPFIIGEFEVPTPVVDRGYQVCRLASLPSPGTRSLILNITADDTGFQNGRAGVVSQVATIYIAGFHTSYLQCKMRLTASMRNNPDTSDWLLDSLTTAWISNSIAFLLKPGSTRGFRIQYNAQCSVPAVDLGGGEFTGPMGTYGIVNLKQDLPTAALVSVDSQGSGPPGS